MNLINRDILDLILAAAETLRNETCRILESYRNNMERERRIGARYKDESDYVKDKQQELSSIARNDIAKAESVFAAKVEKYAGQMKNELEKHLSEPVNQQFRDKLKMIADFDLQPECVEIEDLIRLNRGNQTGLSALARTLEKVDSPYRIQYHSAKDFTNDIAEIRGLGRNLKYIPSEYLHEGIEVYDGITEDYVYPNGNVLHNGISYDRVSLIANQFDFESRIEKIKGLKDTWTADCSYYDADKKAKEEEKQRKILNKYLSDLGLPEEKPISAESETTIEDSTVDNAGVELAKQLGAEKAATKRTYDETIGTMLK